MNQYKEFKFTIIGHACVYLEMDDVRLLIDPWIIGSCYWRSWWNYPKIEEDLLSSLRPTHIYITHLHWDHYHGPSLRFLRKHDPIILLPKSCPSRMIGDMKKYFNFSKIFELDHAKEFLLNNDFKITSYQFNPIIIDSALAIEAGNIKIFNANDTKTFGLSLSQIIKKYKKFDFVFRSHSSASQNPHCINDADKLNLTKNSTDFTNEFLAFSNKVNAYYAIPFASSHIYLHKDTSKYNKLYNSPQRLLTESRKKNHSGSTVKLMPSGSSWSSINGFSINNHNYEKINEHIGEYQILYKKYLESQYQIEENTKPNLIACKRYFKSFFKSLKFIPRKIKFGFVFSLNKKKDIKTIDILILIDLRKSRISIVDNISCVFDEKHIMRKYELDFILETNPKVFNDCNIKKMYNCWGPSKLLKIYLDNEKSLKKYNHFCNLIDLYENDGLPFWNIFSKRQFIVRLSRWRELVDIFIYIFKIKIIKKKVKDLWL